MAFLLSFVLIFETERGKNIWEWTLFIGSVLIPFMFGMIFTSLIQGMPIQADKNIVASFGDYVTFFSIVGGVAVTLISFIHGLNYIRLKTDGPIRFRALKCMRNACTQCCLWA